MNEKLPPDALIEAALLTQTEPLNEKIHARIVCAAAVAGQINRRVGAAQNTLAGQGVATGAYA